MYGICFTEGRAMRTENVRYQCYRDYVFRYFHIYRVCRWIKILS